jgi:hypothetical protein
MADAFTPTKDLTPEEKLNETISFVERHTREVITKSKSGDDKDRKVLKKRLQNFRASVDRITSFVNGQLGQKPGFRTVAYMSLHILIRDSILLGSGLGISDEGRQFHFSPIIGGRSAAVPRVGKRAARGQWRAGKRLRGR